MIVHFVHAMISMLISPQKHRERTVLLFVAPAAFGTKKISRIAFNFRSVSDPIPSLQKAIGIIGTEGANVTNIEPPPGPFKTHHSFSDPIYEEPIERTIKRFIGAEFD